MKDVSEDPTADGASDSASLLESIDELSDLGMLTAERVCLLAKWQTDDIRRLYRSLESEHRCLEARYSSERSELDSIAGWSANRREAHEPKVREQRLERLSQMERGVDALRDALPTELSEDHRAELISSLMPSAEDLTWELPCDPFDPDYPSLIEDVLFNDPFYLVEAELEVLAPRILKCCQDAFGAWVHGDEGSVLERLSQDEAAAREALFEFDAAHHSRIAYLEPRVSVLREALKAAIDHELGVAESE